jgi:hypothetical protein
VKALVCALILAACSSSEKPGESVPTGVTIVAEAGLDVRQGQIGVESTLPGTWVYVEVENRTAEDRAVVVEGTFFAGGKQLVTTASDSLRVPAGQRRVFALVSNGPLPDATRAEVHVLKAPAVPYPDPFAIEDLRFEKVDGGTTAGAMVRNTLDAPSTATVVGVFYDAAGKVLSRPFVLMAFHGASGRPVLFQGPPGATRSFVFVATSTY